MKIKQIIYDACDELDLDFWIKKLTEIKDNKENYLKLLGDEND